VESDPTPAPDRDALEAELSRLEESATYSAQNQFEQSKLWRGANLLLSGPAALLAALSGGAGLADADNRTLAGVLALIAAGLGALITAVNPSSRAERAHTAGNAYLLLQTECRQARLLDLPSRDPADIRERIATLTARAGELNSTADIPSGLAAKRAKRNIDDGRQRYAADD
jgi:hypothetical protein